MADPISGELVIVPDGIAGDINKLDWEDAKAFADTYDDGVNSDYRLITKAEALAILGNAELVAQLGFPVDDDYWTIEGVDAPDAAYYFNPSTLSSNVGYIGGLCYALPIRKVNFYGLPLIESEFGGGLVYDVVAETRTVHVAAKPAEWGDFGTNTWESATGILPAEINEVLFTDLPTRAQALKIFGNSYLVTLAGLHLDNNYWTSDEIDALNAYCWATIDNEIQDADKTNLHYALPVRSEVVPET